MTPQTQAEQKARELVDRCHYQRFEKESQALSELTALIQKADALDKIESMAKAGVDWDICFRDGKFIATDIFNQDEVRGEGETLRSAIQNARKEQK